MALDALQRDGCEIAPPWQGGAAGQQARAPGLDLYAAIRRGVELHREGRFAEAIAEYDAILDCDGRHFDALNNKGIALRALGQTEAAVECLAMATTVLPDRGEAFYNLGNALSALQRDEEACAAYAKAGRLDPGNAGVWRNLAAAQARLGRPDEELAAYQQLVALDPENAEWWNNLGAALYARGKVSAALTCTSRAIALRPGFAVALKNHGVLQAHQGDFASSAVSLSLAVAAGGTDGGTLAALGQSLVQMGDLPAAGDCFRQALAAEPGNLDAALGTARHAFLAGDYARAWPAYRARWRIEGNPYPDNLQCPEWRGEALAGKAILVWAEQGVGDTLNFVRYVPRLNALGARVILLVQASVVEVVKAMPGVDEVLAAGARRPHFDFHVPLLNLPEFVGGGIDEIPLAEGYLGGVAERPGIVLPGARADQLKIGIVWAGNPTHKNDRNRSLRLDELLGLCRVPATQWYSLQIGPGAEQLAESGASAFLRDATPGVRDYADTASLLRQLDLLISVDTSIVHLAGAMGRPVWCLVPFAPDWRWQLGGRSSPWYRSLHLFRQPSPGAWREAIAALDGALRDWVAARRAH